MELMRRRGELDAMQLQRDLLRSEGEVIEQQRLIDNLANDLLRQELHGAELYARQRALERTQREDRRLVEWARGEARGCRGNGTTS